MTRRFTIVMCLLFTMTMTAVGCGQGDEEAAVETSTGWLKLLDSGNVDESWKQSAAMFRNNVSVEDYKKSIQESRGHLGKLMSRKVRTAQAAHSLPNAPRGRYVVVQFDSVFENHPAIVETVTTKYDSGDWRVLGYRSR